MQTGAAAWVRASKVCVGWGCQADAGMRCFHVCRMLVQGSGYGTEVATTPRWGLADSGLPRNQVDLVLEHLRPVVRSGSGEGIKLRHLGAHCILQDIVSRAPS